MKDFKGICLIDKCTENSKEEIGTFFVKAICNEEAELAIKTNIINKGWCITGDIYVTEIQLI